MIKDYDLDSPPVEEYFDKESLSLISNAIEIAKDKTFGNNILNRRLQTKNFY